MSIMSQNLIPVHIAFIPIVIPPLISLFNDLKIDRRLIGLVIGFGLCWPYVYFHMALVKSSIKSFKVAPKAHHPIEFSMIWKAINSFNGYIVGLILGFIVYRKPRNYVQRNVDERETVTELKPYVLIVTIICDFSDIYCPNFYRFNDFGALAGVLVFFISRVYMV